MSNKKSPEPFGTGQLKQFKLYKIRIMKNESKKKRREFVRSIVFSASNGATDIDTQKYCVSYVKENYINLSSDELMVEAMKLYAEVEISTLFKKGIIQYCD